VATIASIKQQVLDIWIDDPSEVTSRVEEFVNDAQVEAEDRHDFRDMRKWLVNVATPATRNLLVNSTNVLRWSPGSYWLDHSGNPHPVKIVDDLGEILREFAPSDTDDDGAPKFIYDVPDSSVLQVYPYPDENTTAGTAYVSTSYLIYLAYIQRLPVLVEGSVNTNWFSDHGHKYLIASAAARGLIILRNRMEASYWTRQAEMEYKKMRRLDKSMRFPQAPSISPSVHALTRVALPR
jgi:hypothetical protein